MSQKPLAMITGSSSGLGLELAKQFAQNGYDVAISGSSDRILRQQRLFVNME